MAQGLWRGREREGEREGGIESEEEREEGNREWEDWLSKTTVALEWLETAVRQPAERQRSVHRGMSVLACNEFQVQLTLRQRFYACKGSQHTLQNIYTCVVCTHPHTSITQSSGMTL